MFLQGLLKGVGLLRGAAGFLQGYEGACPPQGASPQKESAKTAAFRAGADQLMRCGGDAR